MKWTLKERYHFHWNWIGKGITISEWIAFQQFHLRHMACVSVCVCVFVARLNNVAAKMRIKSLATMKSFYCGSTRLFSCSPFYWCSTESYMLWTVVLLYVKVSSFFSYLFVCVCFFFIFELKFLDWCRNKHP